MPDFKGFWAKRKGSNFVSKLESFCVSALHKRYSQIKPNRSLAWRVQIGKEEQRHERAPTCNIETQQMPLVSSRIRFQGICSRKHACFSEVLRQKTQHKIVKPWWPQGVQKMSVFNIDRGKIGFDQSRMKAEAIIAQILNCAMKYATIILSFVQ